MKTLRLLIVLSAFFLTIPFQANGETVDELIDKVISARQNAKFDEAFQLADECISRLPIHPFGYNEKGNALSGMNREEEAIEYYLKALDCAKDNREIIMRNIALQYKTTNRFNASIDWHKKAIDENPAMFALDTLGIADVYLLKGDMWKALSSYEEAKVKIEQSENAFSAVNDANKGIVYSVAAFIAYQLGKDTEALQFAEKAKTVRGTDTANLSYATYLAEMGQTYKAELEFDSVNAGNCESLDLALYYLLSSDKEKAVRYFEKSYYEQKTSEQLASWKMYLRQSAAYPRDRWQKARNQEWLKSKLEE